MARSESGEDGLTLVEMMIAIVVVGFVLMAMASVAFASMRSVQTTERIAAATHLGNELLESYLALPYDSVGLYESPALATFSGSSFEGSPLVLFPDPITPDPRLPQAEQTLTQAGTDYIATTAVVWVDDPGTVGAQDYKRVVVELRWTLRGAEQTSRVEMLRSPSPTDQPLSVTVTPDVVDLDASGIQQQPATLTVEAKEPQTTVTVTWVDRDGVQSGPTTMTKHGNGTVWTKTVDGEKFANGATLFTVTGTLEGTTQKTVTTLGRALFLQPLALEAAQTVLDPATVQYQPDVEFCTDTVRLTTVATGAVLSDPVTATLWPDAAVPYVVPLTAEDPPLVSGTRFYVDLPVADLGIVDGTTEVPLRIDVTRPIGAVHPVASLELAIPVESTPAVVPADEDPATPDHQPCPA